jgi:hypothetical protein
MTSRRDASSLGELLAQSPSLNPPDRVSWHAWREIVGTKIAQRSRPAQLDRSTLLIIVVSPAWAQELSMLQSTILERLRLKVPAVRALRFQVGHVDVPVSTKAATPLVDPAPLPLDLEQRLADVEDESLRAAIKQAAGLNLALRLKRVRRRSSSSKPG